MPFVTRRFAAGELIAQKYLLLHLLGRGTSGEVFRARNVLAGNVLALKLLIEQSSDTELLQRFFREARAINRIAHPNIVSVFDAGYADAIPYLAMEYLHGESLDQLLDRTPRLPIPCAVAIMLRVLDALSAAHNAGIVHRDLKPANVFLVAARGSAPTVKLLDFGVAKIHEDGESSLKTGSGMILGTPDYLSPEQITDGREVDGRSDLFAAGSLLFELLTGQCPFHGSSIIATTFRIVHDSAPSLIQAGGPDDPALAHILTRALAKQRDERYASAADFASDLEQVSPDPAERAAALRDLDVRSPLIEEPWERASPATPGSDPAPRPERSETMKQFPVQPAATAPAAPAAPAPAPGKAKRTWPEFPMVGRRKGSRPAERHVRGTVLLALDRAIATRYGGDVRDEIVGALPREMRDIFRAGAPARDAWYGLDQAAVYLQSSNDIAVHGDAERWQALGYAAVETDLLTLLRSARSHPDGRAALCAVLPVISGLFDFGNWSVDGTAESLRIEIASFGRTPPALHDWLAGVIEHVVRSTGRPYRLAVTRPHPDAEDSLIGLLATLSG